MEGWRDGSFGSAVLFGTLLTYLLTALSLLILQTLNPKTLNP